ncbi:hypothetical protein BpHYR1_027728 [Brachionus plicatilis]|uniref:Uncharacterized protein n=1 Tax=Brachionus plicatilis TaxID=10195 RepID=A0A3M7SKV5_BRAPC|nr:hypothetical protein BpHYR1_027728 [Brachionus plicatilis]
MYQHSILIYNLLYNLSRCRRCQLERDGLRTIVIDYFDCGRSNYVPNFVAELHLKNVARVDMHEHGRRLVGHFGISSIREIHQLLGIEGHLGRIGQAGVDHARV